MSVIVIKQMPGFKKAYKKFHSAVKKQINDAIQVIITDPRAGEEKKGDLAGTYVYKFKVNQHEMLLAYEWNTKERLLLAIGMHENFYRKLKNKKLKSSNYPTLTTFATF